MSGPKVSAYELNANRRLQAACQAKILSGAEVIKNAVARVDALGGKVEELVRELERFPDRAGDAREQAQALQKTYEEAKRKVYALNDQLKALGRLDYRSVFYNAQRELTQRTELLQNLLHEVQDIREQTGSVTSELKYEIQKASKTAGNRTRQAELSIKRDLEKEVSFVVRRDSHPEKAGGNRTSIQAALREASSDRLCPQELRVRAQKLAERLERMDSEEEIRNMQAVSIEPLIRECEQAVCKKQALYEELVQEQESLCGLIGCEARRFEQSDEGIEGLRTEIERLRRIQLHSQEQAEISDCINQVMREMGYDLIGDREVVKKSGRRFRNDLYLFEEGRALSVTQSADGQITMELGGMDNGDRLPDAGEAALLKDDMEMFCDRFEEIEQRLREKGVLLKERVEMLPPDEAYASIINLQDFHLHTDEPVHTLAEVRRGEAGREIRHMRNEG